MKKLHNQMIKPKLVFAFVILSACAGQDKTTHLENTGKETKHLPVPPQPSRLTVINSDYSLGVTIEYILDNDTLTVVWKAELEGEKDSIIFETSSIGLHSLSQTSSVNLDSLNKSYSNKCIEDGSQVTIKSTKQGLTKTVHFSNYYHPEAEKVIKIVNALVPEKFKVWYDKSELIRDLKNCK